MTLTRPVLLAATTALLVLPLAASAADSEEPAATGKDTTWAIAPRDLSFVHDAHGFSFESVSLDGNDRIVGGFAAADDEFSYQFEAVNGDAATGEVRIRFVGLVAFEDRDGDGAYDLGEPTEANYRLQDAEPRVGLDPFYDDGRQVVVTYVLEDGGSADPFSPDGEPAELEIHFFLVERPHSIGGDAVAPTVTRIEARLHGLDESKAPTRHALQVRIASASPFLDRDGSDGRLDVGQDVARLFVDWTPNDTAADATVTWPAQAEGEEESRAQMMLPLGAGPAPEGAFHVGADRYRETGFIETVVQGLAKGDPLVYGVGLGLTVVLVAGAVVLSRRATP